MNLYLFFHGHVLDSEVGRSAEKMDTDQIISVFGKTFKIHLGIGLESQKIVSSQIDFRPSLSRAELISLNKGKVDDTFLIS